MSNPVSSAVSLVSVGEALTRVNLIPETFPHLEFVFGTTPDALLFTYVSNVTYLDWCKLEVSPKSHLVVWYPVDLTISQVSKSGHKLLDIYGWQTRASLTDTLPGNYPGSNTCIRNHETATGWSTISINKIRAASKSKLGPGPQHSPW